MLFVINRQIHLDHNKFCQIVIYFKASFTNYYLWGMSYTSKELKTLDDRLNKLRQLVGDKKVLGSPEECRRIYNN